MSDGAQGRLQAHERWDTGSIAACNSLSVTGAMLLPRGGISERLAHYGATPIAAPWSERLRSTRACQDGAIAPSAGAPLPVLRPEPLPRGGCGIREPPDDPSPLTRHGERAASRVRMRGRCRFDCSAIALRDRRERPVARVRTLLLKFPSLLTHVFKRVWKFTLLTGNVP